MIGAKCNIRIFLNRASLQTGRDLNGQVLGTGYRGRLAPPRVLLSTKIALLGPFFPTRDTELFMQLVSLKSEIMIHRNAWHGPAVSGMTVLVPCCKSGRVSKLLVPCPHCCLLHSGQGFPGPTTGLELRDPCHMLCATLIHLILSL